MLHIYPPKLPLPFDDLRAIYTPIHRLTPLTITNGIQIQSAILPQYILWKDRQTDRRTDRQTNRPTDIWAR